MLNQFSRTAKVAQLQPLGLQLLVNDCEICKRMTRQSWEALVKTLEEKTTRLSDKDKSGSCSILTSVVIFTHLTLLLTARAGHFTLSHHSNFGRYLVTTVEMRVKTSNSS